MMKSLLISAAYLLVIFSTHDYGVYGCSCLQKHPQAAFCSSGFALKGLILGKTLKRDTKHKAIFKSLGLPVPTMVHYEVLVMRVYRGNVTARDDTFAAFFRKTIQTSTQGSSCGIKFTKGKMYLITGRIFDGGVLQTNACDWSNEFNSLTPSMQRGLDGAEYQCKKCRVSTCFNGYCDNDSKCKWQINYGEPIDECTKKHRICKVNKAGGDCEWNNDLFYESCANKLVIDMYKP